MQNTNRTWERADRRLDSFFEEPRDDTRALEGSTRTRTRTTNASRSSGNAHLIYGWGSRARVVIQTMTTTTRRKWEKRSGFKTLRPFRMTSQPNSFDTPSPSLDVSLRPPFLPLPNAPPSLETQAVNPPETSLLTRPSSKRLPRNTPSRKREIVSPRTKQKSWLRPGERCISAQRGSRPTVTDLPLNRRTSLDLQPSFGRRASLPRPSPPPTVSLPPLLWPIRGWHTSSSRTGASRQLSVLLGRTGRQERLRRLRRSDREQHRLRLGVGWEEDRRRLRWRGFL